MNPNSSPSLEQDGRTVGKTNRHIQVLLRCFALASLLSPELASAEDLELLVLLTGTGNQSSPNAKFECMGETRRIGVSPFGSSADFNRFNVEGGAAGAATITLVEPGTTLWSAQLSVGILPECYANNYSISINNSNVGFVQIGPNLNSASATLGVSVSQKNPLFGIDGNYRGRRLTMPADGVSQVAAYPAYGGSVSYSIAGPTLGASIDGSGVVLTTSS